MNASHQNSLLRTAVQAFATLADRGEFDALGRLFADEVRIDYTSAFGGEVETKSRRALMTQWAGLLPGFEATHHQLRNIDVEHNGHHAEGRAEVVADHYLADRFWQITGHYHFSFQHENQSWQITSLRFEAQSEQGDRAILGDAQTRARKQKTAYLQRAQTIDTVNQLLDALETKQTDTFTDLWHEDAIQELPYAPPGLTKRAVGKEAVLALYQAWPDITGTAVFNNRIFHATTDPERVFAEYQGEVAVTTTGRTYRQSYGCLFHVREGRICLLREYFDPAPFIHAFAFQAPA